MSLGDIWPAMMRKAYTLRSMNIMTDTTRLVNSWAANTCGSQEVILRQPRKRNFGRELGKDAALNHGLINKNFKDPELYQNCARLQLQAS